MNPDPHGVVDVADPDVQVPPGLSPLVDVWMRDPRVSIGHDGAYYLIGTTRPEGEINAGRWGDTICLWRSEDLNEWESLGVIWSLEKEGGALANYPVYEGGVGRTYSPEAFRREVMPRLCQPGCPQDILVRRGLWSPDIYWLPGRGEYLLTFCLNTNIAVPPEQWTGHGLFGGNYFLKTPSGDPRGPWELVSDSPMTDHIDGSVFEDDDGAVWFVWQGGNMARFNDRLDAFNLISDPWQTEWNPEPAREGPCVVKHDGRYHLFVTVHSNRGEDGTITYAHEGHNGPGNFSYDLIQMSSERLTGPYGPRSLVALGAGHGHPLRDRNGDWWLTCFGNINDPYCPFETPCRPYLVPMEWRDGLFRPRR